MNANKRGLDAPFRFKFVKELMSKIYRRMKQNKADGKLSLFYKSSLRGEKSITEV